MGQEVLERKGLVNPRGGSEHHTGLFLEAPAPPKCRKVWGQVCTGPPGP